MSAGFVRATKRHSRLRLALLGPAGSGKTYTALSIAQHLGGPVGLVDTERGSASKYADRFRFDVMELATFDPRAYIEAIHAAARAGFHTLIIDSLSHAWMGKDGALEMVDRVVARQRTANSFTAWGEVTPHHNAMLDAILQAPMHVIVTLRVKTAYVLETNAQGRQVPRKVGLAPVQRDGVEYEFDVVADLTPENLMIIGKTRCSELVGREFPKAGKHFAEVINAWLSDGAAPATSTTATAPAESGPALVQRDVKPANEAGSASAPAETELTFDERTLIDALTPLLVAAKTHDELRGLCRRAVAAGGGKDASAAYKAWYNELKAQTLAALGPEPKPGPAKVAALVAQAPSGKAAAS